jgi:hypothetical protein
LLREGPQRRLAPSADEFGYDADNCGNERVGEKARVQMPAIVTCMDRESAIREGQQMACKMP